MTEARRRMRRRSAWWAAVAEAMALLPSVRISLWLGGYGRTMRVLLRTLGTPQREAGSPGSVPDPVSVISSAVTTVARFDPLHSRCLARSITIWWMSRRRGYDVELVMGVAPPEGTHLPAHAWVEHRGIPVNDTDDVRRRYAVLG